MCILGRIFYLNLFPKAEFFFRAILLQKKAETKSKQKYEKGR